jgi:putative FmdB family regulatory protein
MPLYEYQCETCEHRFEKIQKFSDPPPAACPKCGGPVRKLFSSPAIQFKGSGFYITDYAKKSSSEAGSKSSSQGESSASGSSESKSSESKSSDSKSSDSKSSTTESKPSAKKE